MAAAQHIQIIGRRRLIVVALCLMVCATGIVMLSGQFNEKLRILATAQTDSIQWTMSQLEVEALKFELAVFEARQPDHEDISAVRTRFDVLYSRILMLERSAIFDDLAARTSWYARDVGAMTDLLDQLVPTIDAPDAELRAALPELADEAQHLRMAVRDVALRAIQHFDVEREAERAGISDILVRIASLTAILILLLLGVTLMFWRLTAEARRQEHTLRSTTARLEAIIATAIDAVIVSDEHGHILNFNTAAEAVFGYSAGEALGKNVISLFAPDRSRAAYEAAFAEYLETGASDYIGKGRVQLEAKDKYGHVFPAELTIDQVTGSEERIFVSFLRDISHRVAAEAELRTARDQAIAGEQAKAELLAVMSHEMRTPLNGLLGTIELLEDTDLAEDQRSYARIMRNSGKLLLHQVNSVLDISRADSGMMTAAAKPFDLNQLLEELVDGQRKFAADRGNALILEAGNPLTGYVVGDPIKLRQIALNLIGNALKFTCDGTVRVTASVTEDDRVEITVADTGVGIPQSELDRIFDEFVTLDTNYDRAAEGTGLGLAISQRLARVMGGEITVESTPGEGSTFRLALAILPLEEDRGSPPWAHNTEAETGAAAPVVGPMRVLMVEDNQINRIVAREMLEKDGHWVTEAHNGQEGAAVALSDPFDLILMDISMPHMDGVSCTEAIRANAGPNRETPIVALTAHALPDEVERFHEAGMDATLTKPITRQALRTILGDIQGGGNGGGFEQGPNADEDVLDYEALAALTETMAPDHLTRLLGEFFEETDEELTVLARAMDEVEAHDHARRNEIADRLHRVSGSAAVFGGIALRRAMIAVERDLREGSLETAYGAWPGLTALWRDTKRALDLTLLDDAA